MKRRNAAIVLAALISLAGCSSSIPNPLIGTWRVYKLQGPDGKITDLPSTYNMEIAYTSDQSTQYVPGKDPVRLKYSLERDKTGLFIKVNWNGQWYGQRFAVLENGDIRWDLFEPGTNRPTKMWMRKVSS